VYYVTQRKDVSKPSEVEEAVRGGGYEKVLIWMNERNKITLKCVIKLNFKLQGESSECLVF
jgi:hypothetical protein